MKQYEKRAVEKAIEIAKKRIEESMTEEDFLKSEFDNEKFKQRIAHEAVKIAQLRAHRLYDNITQQEALEYARAILERSK